MAAIIIIQREVAPENQEELFALMRQLRAKAVLLPGYIYGETLFSTSKGGTLLVISRWQSLKYWRAWENSPERQAIMSQIAPLLKAPAVTSVYFDSPAQVPEGA